MSERGSRGKEREGKNEEARRCGMGREIRARRGGGRGELEGEPASSQRRREGLGDEVDEAKG